MAGTRLNSDTTAEPTAIAAGVSGQPKAGAAKGDTQNSAPNTFWVTDTWVAPIWIPAQWFVVRVFKEPCLACKIFPRRTTGLTVEIIMKPLPLLFAIFSLVSVPVGADEPQPPRLVSVQRIWDSAPHNAFTDLIRFRGRWYCVFREGTRHVSPDGALRVITSDDGIEWESAALITSNSSDLRDAKLSVTPDDQLMLSGAEAMNHPANGTHQSLAWFSPDGKTWSRKYEVGDRDYWLWRMTWRKGHVYSFGYGCRSDNRGLRLFSSSDGKTFETLVDKVDVEGTYPNETSMVFLPDETAYCLLRQDGQPNFGFIGKSRPPYTDWTWKSLGVRIGGPDMIRLPDGRFVAVVRLYDSEVRTSLCWLDPEKAKLTEALQLPSGGDCSYAGLVWHEGLLWISYYSSHQGKTAIYLAKVEFANESDENQ